MALSATFPRFRIGITCEAGSSICVGWYQQGRFRVVGHSGYSGQLVGPYLAEAAAAEVEHLLLHVDRHVVPDHDQRLLFPKARVSDTKRKERRKSAERAQKERRKSAERAQKEHTRERARA
eukprot:3415513-Rhodomonas_salina.1